MINIECVRLKKDLDAFAIYLMICSQKCCTAFRDFNILRLLITSPAPARPLSVVISIYLSVGKAFPEMVVMNAGEVCAIQLERVGALATDMTKSLLQLCQVYDTAAQDFEVYLFTKL